MNNNVFDRFSCVIEKDGEVIFSSTDAGIRPVIEVIDKKLNAKGSCVSDKIVGKAAALLYSYLEVKSVYAAVMSKKGREVLQKHGIEAKSDVLTEEIRNRAGDGICPMEAAVADIEEPSEAVAAIKNEINALRKK